MNHYEVLIYVEGSSDAQGLRVLLKDLIAEKQHDGVSIRFLPSGGKKKLLNQGLKRAVNIVLHHPKNEVVLVPDLYPQNMGFEHESQEELFRGIEVRLTELFRQKASGDSQARRRIQYFCFKHDFECLLLAASDNLRAHLNTNSLSVSWTEPVEDQNHDDPPKRVVERIFDACGQKYVATEDAFNILANAEYQQLAAACPQGFKPFVEYLKAL